MKNKKLTYYFLIPAVITIWGIIIYQIMIKDDNLSGMRVFNDVPKKEQAVGENQNYVLKNNYADPFFHQAPEVLNTPEQSTKVVKPKIENTWPAIRFNGYVLNGSKIRGHLTINGEDKILQVNEPVLDQYIISAMTSDSVQIKYQSQLKWFKK